MCPRPRKATAQLLLEARYNWLTVLTLDGDLGMLLLGAIWLDHWVKERRGRCGRRGRALHQDRREEEEQQEAGETRREGGVLRGRRHGGDLSSSCQGGRLGYGCSRTGRKTTTLAPQRNVNFFGLFFCFCFFISILASKEKKKKTT